jgi:hypothetical protein
MSKLGFRPARVDDEVQAELTKQETTRLNVEIAKELAIKLKIYAATKDKKMKDIVIAAIENFIK